MIRNQWYAVLESTEVPAGRMVTVRRMGEDLLFFRDESDEVGCLLDRCAHRGVRLSAGSLTGDRVRCPFHGLEYDIRGRVTAIPANGYDAPVPAQFRTQSYPTHEVDGFIFIWWGLKPPADLSPPEYYENLSGLSRATARDPWHTHYSRVLENQLDVAHLPFVHHNTIGRGNRTLVDGPAVEWLGENRMRVFVSNRVDGPPPPRKTQDFPGPTGVDALHLDVILPNLWQNHISESLRVTAAFVPVDGEHTLLYLRFYQKFMRVPLLQQLVAFLGSRFNLIIAHQDRRVVETQRPYPSSLRGGEKLFQADYPIVEYRRRRAELQAASGQAEPVNPER
jgi:phenylpropionate dioxygenase-like ring-hydroxylating dioxygenase large terminal subunit